MKVYVITKGVYSDYHICGVAVDREIAEKLVPLFSDKLYDAHIEEYDTDRPLQCLAGRFPFTVYFYRDGDVIAYNKMESNEFQENIIKSYDDNENRYVEMFVSVVATNSTHAIKIACDKRAQYLAEKAGV